MENIMPPHYPDYRGICGSTPSVRVDSHENSRVQPFRMIQGVFKEQQEESNEKER
jgi:hypothetical protein